MPNLDFRYIHVHCICQRSIYKKGFAYVTNFISAILANVSSIDFCCLVQMKQIVLKRAQITGGV